jgi:hypothetical protein
MLSRQVEKRVLPEEPMDLIVQIAAPQRQQLQHNAHGILGFPVAPFMPVSAIIASARRSSAPIAIARRRGSAAASALSRSAARRRRPCRSERGNYGLKK